MWGYVGVWVPEWRFLGVMASCFKRLFHPSSRSARGLGLEVLWEQGFRHAGWFATFALKYHAQGSLCCQPPFNKF